MLGGLVLRRITVQATRRAVVYLRMKLYLCIMTATVQGILDRLTKCLPDGLPLLPARLSTVKSLT